MNTNRTANRFGPVQIGIVITTLVTALIHFYIASMLGGYLFILNGLGYLALMVALLLPQPLIGRVLPANLARSFRPFVRYAFIGYTLLTILLWVVMGSRNALAYVDKLAEVVLVGLLWMDRSHS
jgi:hypothetical protein